MSKSEITSADRREFLKVTTGGVATMLLGQSILGGQQTAFGASAPDKLRIDVHGHYFPNDYLDMLDGFGGGETGTAIAGKAPMPGGSGSPAELEGRFQMMDRAGVQMMVLSAAPQLPYFENKQNAITADRFINDAYADIVRRHPER